MLKLARKPWNLFKNVNAVWEVAKAFGPSNTLIIESIPEKVQLYLDNCIQCELYSEPHIMGETNRDDEW